MIPLGPFQLRILCDYEAVPVDSIERDVAAISQLGPQWVSSAEEPALNVSLLNAVISKHL